jgi:hypothetical protein
MTTMQTIPSTQSASVPEDPDFRAVLRAVHLEVAAIVAEFDLGDATLWTKTAEIVSDVVTEASDMAALLAGAPSETPATGVPPVVRVRELAAAQRRLFGVLDVETPAVQQRTLRESADRVHGLGQWLAHLARRADVGSQR